MAGRACVAAVHQAVARSSRWPGGARGPRAAAAGDPGRRRWRRRRVLQSCVLEAAILRRRRKEEPGSTLPRPNLAPELRSTMERPPLPSASPKNVRRGLGEGVHGLVRHAKVKPLVRWPLGRGADERRRIAHVDGGSASSQNGSGIGGGGSASFHDGSGVGGGGSVSSHDDGGCGVTRHGGFFSRVDSGGGDGSACFVYCGPCGGGGGARWPQLGGRRGCRGGAEAVRSQGAAQRRGVGKAARGVVRHVSRELRDGMAVGSAAARRRHGIRELRGGGKVGRRDGSCVQLSAGDFGLHGGDEDADARRR
uniref:Uncharacterized protein n=1 Tax=Arundo donax TaxID=35708 RepID=A0A0A8YN38_ARUDO